MKSTIKSCLQCGTKNRIPIFKQHLSPKCGRCQAKMDLRGQFKPIILNDHDFSQFIQDAPLPVLVDFYSPTCGPCQMLAPIIETAVNRFYDKLFIAKLDTTSNPETAMRYQIRGVPTLLFFREGKPVDQVVGAQPEPQFMNKVIDFLNNK